MHTTQTLENVKLTINGEEFAVTNVTLTYDDYESIQATVEGVQYPPKDKKEEDMCYDRMTCDNGCDRAEKACEDPYYSGRGLVKKINDLSLTEDDKLLLKYGVIREDGTITETGKEVLLNLLLNEYSERVIEALRDLDKEEKKNKK